MAKVGFVTEGDAEIASLPLLFGQLQERTSNVFLKPVRANVDPLAPVPVIAKGISERIRLAISRGASEVIVLLDRETHSDSAGQRARDIQGALDRLFPGVVKVVVKDRMYENWLIACPKGFESQKARFPHGEKACSFPPGSADEVQEPSRMISRSLGRNDYEKVSDAVRLMKHAQVENLARNSRSFRRLLAVAGDKLYADGSCTYQGAATAPTTRRRTAKRTKGLRRG